MAKERQTQLISIIVLLLLFVPSAVSARRHAPSARINGLIKRLQSSDEKIATEAAYALAKQGDAAIGPLAKLLSHKHLRVRTFAIGALTEIGPPKVLIPLINALLDPSLQGEAKFSRVIVAKVLGRWGKMAAPAIPALVKCLGDSTKLVRWSAAEALSGLGPKGISALRRALRSRKKFVRRGGAIGLNHAGPKAVAAIADLIVALKDRDETVRYNAVSALGKLGPAAKAALPALKRVWNTDNLVQATAGEAIQKIGGKPRGPHRPLTVRCPKGSKPQTRVYAAPRMVIRRCLLRGGRLAKAALLDYREERLFAVKHYRAGKVVKCRVKIKPAALPPVQGRKLRDFLKGCP